MILGFRARLKARREAAANEGPGISKEDLLQMQGDYAPRCCARDLRERKAQAAPGISSILVSGDIQQVRGELA
jgi:hypothetical protein